MASLWPAAAVAAAVVAVVASLVAIRAAGQLRSLRRQLGELADDVAAALDGVEVNRTAWKRIEGRVAKRQARDRTVDPTGRPDPVTDPEGWRTWALQNRHPLRMN